MYDLHDRCIIAHATLAGLAVCLLAPAAILTARWGRTKPAWLHIHRTLMVAVVLLITIVLGLGLGGVHALGLGNQLSGENSDLHHKLGFSTFFIVWAQFFLGIFAHTSSKGLSSLSNGAVIAPGKSFVRYFHIFAGISTMAILYATFETGLDEWGSMSDVMTSTPQAVYIVFWILLGLAVSLWVYGIPLEVDRMILLRQETKAPLEPNPSPDVKGSSTPELKEFTADPDAKGCSC